MKYNIMMPALCLFAVSFIVYPVFAAVSGDCRTCHQNNAGINASDTILPDERTCFQCHNELYPPNWQGVDVHGIHLYNIQVLSPEEYILRHPQTELQCSVCHQHVYECNDCHIKEMPHIEERTDCENCHNTMANIFKHQTIHLTEHNLFGIDAPASCDICHNRAAGVLKLASGKNLAITDSHELCRQCHSTTYREWEMGDHWVAASEMNTEKIDRTCSYCHDVHAPELLYWKPPPSDSRLLFVLMGIVFSGIVFLFSFLFIRKRHRLKK